MKAEINERLRQLPAVDRVIAAVGDVGLPHWAVCRAAREAVQAAREAILEGAAGSLTEVLREAVVARARTLVAPSLERVINATGVVLHTNLGRAPLPEAAIARLGELNRGYCNLEYDLVEGRRGSRHSHLRALVCELTGAEDAVVTNNNAAAVLLCVSALSQGRDVVISRGELVEIGGSFRLPDVMALCGARLKEVGTTNRTHRHDYERAIDDDTGLLLKVHRSNFAMRGFVKEVELAELVALGRARRVPTMFDLGSGLLESAGLTHARDETSVEHAVAAGFDVVTFSGDKLLGGPQAGLAVGRREVVEHARAHPLMRAVRPDKLCLAALEATLALYRDGRAAAEVPVIQMLSVAVAELSQRRERVLSEVRAAARPEWQLEPVDLSAPAGGGAAPAEELPSLGIAVHHADTGPQAIASALRAGQPPVVGRIEADRFVCDLRTVLPQELPLFIAALIRLTAEGPSWAMPQVAR